MTSTTTTLTLAKVSKLRDQNAIRSTSSSHVFNQFGRIEHMCVPHSQRPVVVCMGGQHPWERENFIQFLNRPGCLSNHPCEDDTANPMRHTVHQPYSCCPYGALLTLCVVVVVLLLLRCTIPATAVAATSFVVVGHELFNSFLPPKTQRSCT